MEKKDERSFTVGRWRVAPDLDCITRGSEIVNLRPQVMELLVYLAERSGEVVSADELLDKLWTDKVVTGASVYNCIAELRHSLDAGGDASSYIQTIPKKGYRLVAPIAESGPAESSPGKNAGMLDSGPGILMRYTGIVIVVLAAALLAMDRFVIEGPAKHSVPGEPNLSIVVLPFSDLSPDQDNAYFCDGITEELVNGLARLGALKVVSHASSKSMVAADLSTPELTDKLGTTHVLKGSVRKAGDRVRITAQLIDARSETYLWSQTYDRGLADVFAIQDEISAQILDELKIRLRDSASPTLTTDPRVFDFYLRGRYLVTKRTADALWDAVALFEQASEIDPEYAPVQAGLAKALYLVSEPGSADTPDIRNRAAAAINRALDIDPLNADALAVKGRMLTGEDMDAARTYFEQAVANNPNSSDARRWLALSLSETDPIRYLDVMREAYLVDPLLSPLNFHRTDALSRLGHQDEALDAVREWRDLYPGHPGPYAMAGIVHARSGNMAMALRSYFIAYQQAPNEALVGDLPWLLMDVNELELADAWAREGMKGNPDRYLVPRTIVALLLGRRSEALDLLANIEKQHPEWWSDIGQAYVMLGEFDRAGEAWERGLRDPETDVLTNVFESWGVFNAIHYALALQRTGTGERSMALIDDALALAEKQVDAGMKFYGRWSKAVASPRFHAAALSAMRGNKQDSLEFLLQDVSGGTVSCPVCLRVWPHFDSLRDNSAFVAFVAEQDATNEMRRQRFLDEGLLLTPEQVLSAGRYSDWYAPGL